MVDEEKGRSMEAGWVVGGKVVMKVKCRAPSKDSGDSHADGQPR